jgi:hypothetical protein
MGHGYGKITTELVRIRKTVIPRMPRNLLSCWEMPLLSGQTMAPRIQGGCGDRNRDTETEMKKKTARVCWERSTTQRTVNFGYNALTGD